MTGSLIVDASAAMALLRREPKAATVKSILRAAIEDGTELHVPDLFWLEVTNVLVRRYRVPTTIAVEAIRDLDELDLISAEIDRPLLLLALAHAADTGLSVYDGVYLALTETLDGQVLTLDDRLAAAAGDRALPSRPTPRRLAEEPKPYRTGVVPAHLTAIGAYLGRLRGNAEAKS
jgi:predicted nucleic acid-binding protein